MPACVRRSSRSTRTHAPSSVAAVELLTTLERRLELLEELGVEDVLVVAFTVELAALAPEAFARTYLAAIGTEIVAAGAGFRFGHRRAGDLELLETLGFDVRPVPVVEGISSTRIRQLVDAGEVRSAAALLGRPPEVDGTVVSGDARGTTLGFPTANLEVEPVQLVPAFGIYAGAVDGRRAAVSIGVNPQYGGSERRIEAFLLDFEGDLYGRRLVVELWERLREERDLRVRGRARGADRPRRGGDARGDAARLTALSQARSVAHTRAAPLRLGSPAADVRPTALTPPK